jgi:hypothetical protein
MGETVMNAYRCYLYGAPGTKMQSTLIHGDTDEDARKIVLQILRERPEIDRAEVWRECDLAFRLNRHAIAAENGT